MNRKNAFFRKHILNTKSEKDGGEVTKKTIEKIME
jgi:hypothetical protein